MSERKAIPVWRPTIDGKAVEGWWQVPAKTAAAAKIMIEERMQRRAYFPLCRKWIASGENVEEVVDDK